MPSSSAEGEHPSSRPSPEAATPEHTAYKHTASAGLASFVRPLCATSRLSTLSYNLVVQTVLHLRYARSHAKLAKLTTVLSFWKRHELSFVPATIGSIIITLPVYGQLALFRTDRCEIIRSLHQLQEQHNVRYASLSRGMQRKKAHVWFIWHHQLLCFQCTS